MTYAPGAPRMIWSLPGISDGAKLTIMHWWGKADHEAQKACTACTVWAPAGTRPDGSRMTPTESLLADLREGVHPGKADRTLRGYIAELRSAGLASVDGRCVSLTPPDLAMPRPPEPGCVYAIEFSNGIVKVGRSTNANVRIDAHRGSAAQFRVDVVRSEVRRVSDMVGSESDLLDHLARTQERSSGSEWFVGGYEQAVAWLNGGDQ